MKKKTAGIIYGILLFGILATVVNAQVSTPNFFKKVGNAILMLQTPWELGSSSVRVAKGWFTNLDSTNATIGSLQISSSVTPGPLTVAASSNPDIRFTGDSNTGISWIDADRMALMTGGTNRLTVNSSGNVGIGTTGPQKLLHIEGTSTGDFPLRVSGRTDVLGQWTGIQFGLRNYPVNYAKGGIVYEGQDDNARGKMHFIMDGTADSSNADLTDSKVTIQYNGNVGIGTTSPVSLLSILTAPTASANYGTLSVGGGPWTGTGRFAGNANGTSLAVNEVSGYLGYLMELQVNGVRQFGVSSGGYITAANTIGGSYFLGTAAGTSTLTFNNFQVTSTAIGTGQAVRPFSISPIYNQPSATSVQNTDFLINRTETSLGTTPGLQYLIDAGSGGASYVSKFSVTNGGQGYFAGNVGIGTTAPSQKLEINGNTASGGGSAGKAMCWKADGKTLGYCSTVVGVDGSCTCN